MDEEINQKQESSTGKMFTDFEVMTLSEETRKISDHVGKSKLFLLNFWAFWCGSCIAEMPFLKKLYEEYKPKGLEITGISMDTSLKRWIGALDKIDTPWMHVSDLKGTDSELAKSYSIRGIPYAVLLDQEGVILKTGNPERWEDELKRLLGED